MSKNQFKIWDYDKNELYYVDDDDYLFRVEGTDFEIDKLTKIVTLPKTKLGLLQLQATEE